MFISPLVGCFIGDEILPNYMGITISQYKDPHKQISIMECHKGFERCSSRLWHSDPMQFVHLFGDEIPWFLNHEQYVHHKKVLIIICLVESAIYFWLSWHLWDVKWRFFEAFHDRTSPQRMWVFTNLLVDLAIVQVHWNLLVFGWTQPNSTHRIHVWYIYLHLLDFYGKCR